MGLYNVIRGDPFEWQSSPKFEPQTPKTLSPHTILAIAKLYGNNIDTAINAFNVMLNGVPKSDETLLERRLSTEQKYVVTPEGTIEPLRQGCCGNCNGTCGAPQKVYQL